MKNRASNHTTRRSVRPTVEMLEDRLAPAIFTVNSLADLSIAGGVNTANGRILGHGNTVTLRSAIDAANSTPGGNTIRLSIPGDYKITLPGANTGTDLSGAFAILPTGGNLNILNTSGRSVTVDGNHLDRDINPGDDSSFNDEFTVTLQGLTITNGIASPGDGADGSGGGIRSQGIGSVTLNNVVVAHNLATADGGGISMENAVSAHWVLTVNHSTFSDNHAGDAGGGIESDGTGQININSGSVITGNTAVNQGAGIWLDAIATDTLVPPGTVNSVTVSEGGAGYDQAPTVTFTSVDGQGSGATGVATVTNGAVTSVTVTNPGTGYDQPPTVSFTSADGLGSGAAATANLSVVLGSARLNVTGTLISFNQALSMGTFGGGIGNAGNGPVTITNSTIEDNFSGGAGGGFADQNNQGTLVVTSSLFLNNVSAGVGGGIQEGGPNTSITTTQIQGNVAGNAGGGIFANGAAFSLLRSTVDRNVAAGDGAGGGGGGINLQTTGTATITDSTITGNHALNNAGANGGGIDATALAGALALVNDTINNNDASAGGGIFWGGLTGSTFSLHNTIVAGNFAMTGTDINNPAGTFTDNGGNLIGVTDGSAGLNAGTTQVGSAAVPLNALLAVLSNYGGPAIGAPGSLPFVLETEALLAGSHAIGKGVATGTPSVDERGNPTVVKGTANIGAVANRP
jgi:hypothetical protein